MLPGTNVKTVTEILWEKYGIEATPGEKVLCRKCNKGNLYIFPHNLSAYCFSPGCASHVGAKTGSHFFMDELQEVLWEICQDWRGGFHALPRKGSRNAYTYCHGDRGIHEGVLDAALIGVVPTRYDLEKKFSPLLGRLSTEIAERKKEYDAAKGNKDLRAEISKKLAELTKFQAEVENKKSTLAARLATMDAKADVSFGWLAFFYTDHNHQITSIRFREAYQKKFLSIVFGKARGVFGLNIFCPREDKPSSAGEGLTVVEGEFNLLQMHSLELRSSAQVDTLAVLNPVLAVGSVSGADFNVITSLYRTPTICFDHDENSAGFELVKEATKHSSFFAFTVPKPKEEEKSDLDSFIQSFGSDLYGCYAALTDLINGSGFYPRRVDAIAEEIDFTRNSKAKAFEIDKRVASIIKNETLDRGELLALTRGSVGYVFDGDLEKVVEIGAENIEFKRLLHRYGINATESIYGYIGSNLLMESLESGRRTEVYKFSHYDARTNAIYIANGDEVLKLTKDSIESVHNGTDGVLFLENATFEPFKLDLGNPPTDKPVWKFLIEPVNFLVSDDPTDGTLTLEDKRRLYLLWIFSLFFDELMQTKAILGFIGEKGSGKSSNLRRLLKVLFGKNAEVSSIGRDPRDFDAKVTHDHVVVFDNVDQEIPWLPDRLAVVATGGVVAVRELFTTNKLKNIPTSCFLAVTSRTPHFNRDDITDRMLPLFLRRLNETGDGFKPESELIREVLENRDRIMTDLVLQLQRVLGALEKNRHLSPRSNFRMADFGSFSFKVMDGLWSISVEEAKRMFQSLDTSQSEFMLSDNPIHLLLKSLVEGKKTIRLTTTELCKKMNESALAQGISFPGNPITLGRDLMGMKNDLSKFFEIKTSTENGARVWEFSQKKSAAPLGGKKSAG